MLSPTEQIIVALFVAAVGTGFLCDGDGTEILWGVGLIAVAFVMAAQTLGA